MGQRIVLSPITLLELLSHLSLHKGETVLRQVQSVWNWVDPAYREILPSPSVAIAYFGFGVTFKDDWFEAVKRNLDICMTAQDADEVQPAALRVIDALKQKKATTVGLFEQLVDLWRKGTPKPEDFDQVWLSGLAQRLGIDPSRYRTADVIEALSAYHEFERERLRVAAQNPTYNFEKWANDVVDAEQLPYLADSRLRFLTDDGGYLKRIKMSQQKAQIHLLGRKLLNTGDDVDAVLRAILI
jgi:hypothetical protein